MRGGVIRAARNRTEVGPTIIYSSNFCRPNVPIQSFRSSITLFQGEGGRQGGRGQGQQWFGLTGKRVISSSRVLTPAVCVSPTPVRGDE